MNSLWLAIYLALIGLVSLELRAAEPSSPPTPAVDLYGDPLPAGVSMRLGTVRFRSATHSRPWAFSPDGKSLTATCMFNDDYGVCVWDVATGKQTFQLSTGMEFLNSLSKGTDGWFGLAANQSREVDPNGASYLDLNLWNLDTKEHRGVAISYNHVVRFALAAEKGIGVCSIGTKGRVFSAITGEAIAETEFASANRMLEFSPDSRTVAAIGNDKTVRVWPFATGEKPRELLAGLEGVSSLSFTPDGDALLVGLNNEGDRAALLIDAATGATRREFKTTAGEHNVFGCCFSADGTRLAAIDRDNSRVLLWDARSGDRIPAIDRYYGNFSSPCFSPDSRLLAVGGSGAVQIFDAVTGEFHGDELAGAFAPAVELVVSPDSRLAASGGSDGVVHLWDLESGRARHVFRHGENRGKPPQRSKLGGLVFSPDSRQLATSSVDTTVRIWDVESGILLHRLEGHGPRSYLQTLAFSRDGEHLRSWGDVSKVFTWRATDGERSLDLSLTAEGDMPTPAGAPKEGAPAEEWKPRIIAAKFSGDGTRLVISAREQGYIFDGATGGLLAKFPGLDEGIAREIDISADNRFFVMSRTAPTPPLADVAPNEYLVHAVDIEDGALLFETAIAGKSPGPIAISGDGSRFAVTGQGAPIQICSATTGEHLRTIEPPPGYIYSLAFTPDGRKLLAGMADTTILVWDVDVSE